MSSVGCRVSKRRREEVTKCIALHCIVQTSLTIDEFEVPPLAVAVVGNIVIPLQAIRFHLQIEYARH